MPPVMDTTIKVDTRTYGTDDAKLPTLGPRIPFNGAPAFQEWDEVTGNVMREIRGNLNYVQTGNMTSFLSGTLDEYIETDYICTVVGNLTFTIEGTSNLSYYGAYVQLNGNTMTEHFTGIATRLYQSNLVEKHPETWLQWFTDSFHRYDLRITLYDILKLDVCVAAVSVNGAKFDASMWKGEISVYKTKFEAIETAISGFVTKIRALSNKLIVTSALIGILRFGTPFKPNALPAPTPITPFD